MLSVRGRRRRAAAALGLGHALSGATSGRQLMDMEFRVQLKKQVTNVGSKIVLRIHEPVTMSRRVCIAASSVIGQILALRVRLRESRVNIGRYHNVESRLQIMGLESRV